MSYSLHSLKRDYIGDYTGFRVIWRTTIGLIQGDIRSLDYTGPLYL